MNDPFFILSEPGYKYSQPCCNGAADTVSFVPSLLVMVTIVTGKQLAHNAPTHGIGLRVMWTGIALVAAADGWLLTRVVRR